MSLPSSWVDRIFDKLTLTYGQAFLRRWQDLDMNAVKSDWAHELDGFDQNPKAIAYALQHLNPEKPPTVLEFRALAYKCPSEQPVMIDQPRATAERIASELLRMAPMRNRTYVDGREWARRIVARHAQGDRIRPYTLNCAQEALGIKRIKGQA